MTGHNCTDEELRATLAAIEREGSINSASRAMGLARSTVQNRLRTAKIRGITVQRETVEFPDFVTEGDDDEPIDEVVDRLTRNFERAKRNHDARRWFTIKVKESLPIGILIVGDVHIDDNGCNWPVLRKHIEIASTTEGIYALNIGDTGNDWGGRLIKKYADQDTSVHTARRLVEWLLLDSGMPWLVWLHGNHQHMSDSMPLHEEMNRRYGTRRVPMLDWEARFVVQFANGAEFRVNAAHDFAGNSMWNPNHGAVKAAKFGNDIDLLVCGHKHNYAVSHWEMPEQGNAPLMVRVRGYKHLDDYARRIGKYEQEEGQSILVVLDPNAETSAGRTLAFVDVQKGADYLTFLREKAERHVGPSK